jgi:hypothetical protein
LNVKICITVNIILVLPWGDWQVLNICDFGSTLKSGQAKLSQGSTVGSPSGHPQSAWLREEVESVYFRRESRIDSFTAVHILNAIAVHFPTSNDWQAL